MARTLRTLGTAAIVLAAPVAAASPAAEDSCPLALVLALDASSSIDASEDRLQLDGLASALLDDTVRAAILDLGGVLMTAFEWSGTQQQVTIADWTFLDDGAAIAGFAGRIAAHRRTYHEYPTAVGYALGNAAVRLNNAPLACVRNVIDVSGDGVLNDGFGPAAAYRHFEFGDATVNGLVITGEQPDPVAYYLAEVLRGPGAFLEIADGYEDYARAMRRKLLREIRGPVLSGLR